MTSTNTFKNCLICLKNNNVMISLEEVLTGYDLSVAEVLKNLHFLTISEDANLQETLCFICVAKIQSCFEFKILCGQRNNTLITRSHVTTYDHSPIIQDVIPLKNIKEEKEDWDENTTEVCEKNPIEVFYFDELNVDETPQDRKNINVQDDGLSNRMMNITQMITEENYDSFEIDGGIFEVKKENICVEKSDEDYDLGKPMIIDEVPENGANNEELPQNSEDQLAESSDNPMRPRSKSLNVTPITCPICHKVFKKEKYLRDHSIVHTGLKPFACNICNRSFNRSHILARHKLVHNDKKPFTCDICGKSYTQYNCLYEHKFKHSDEKAFVCDICNKSFCQSSNLLRHRLIHYGKKSHVCDVCNRSFSQQSTLRRHKLTHTDEKSFACEICNKSFIRLASFIHHTAIHPGEETFDCDVCNKSIIHHGGFASHKLMHNAEESNESIPATESS